MKGANLIVTATFDTNSSHWTFGSGELTSIILAVSDVASQSTRFDILE
jgi:hypothetical protein